METPLIFLDPDTELNLQSHIRQKMVEAIVGGVFPVGKRLPSSRKLAEQLGVARNTVVLVYEQLIDEGYVVSRERSGIFVNAQFLEGRVGFDGDCAAIKRESASWQRFIRRKASDKKHFEAPPNWQRFPYPFLDGQFDQSLFPAKEWREASRQALTIGQIKQWASESGGADDPMLVDEIRTKILPRRGILLTAAGTWAFHFSALPWVYWVANVAVGITWAFVISYLLGLCAEFDTTGQMAALGGFASKMGLASGPMAAALVVGDGDYATMLKAGVLSLLLCLALVAVPARLLDKRS